MLKHKLINLSADGLWLPVCISSLSTPGILKGSFTNFTASLVPIKQEGTAGSQTWGRKKRKPTVAKENKRTEQDQFFLWQTRFLFTPDLLRQENRCASAARCKASKLINLAELGVKKRQSKSTGISQAEQRFLFQTLPLGFLPNGCMR